MSEIVDNIRFIPTGPSSTICFEFDGKTCEFSFTDGKLIMKGNMPLDESAKVFFELLKPYVDDYIKGIMPHDNLKYLEWCANESKHE